MQALVKVSPKVAYSSLEQGSNFVLAYNATMWDEGKTLKFKTSKINVTYDPKHQVDGVPSNVLDYFCYMVSTSIFRVFTLGEDKKLIIQDIEILQDNY